MFPMASSSCRATGIHKNINFFMISKPIILCTYLIQGSMHVISYLQSFCAAPVPWKAMYGVPVVVTRYSPWLKINQKASGLFCGIFPPVKILRTTRLWRQAAAVRIQVSALWSSNRLVRRILCPFQHDCPIEYVNPHYWCVFTEVLLCLL